MGLTLADVLQAAQRIRGLADATPLVPAPSVSALTGADFWLKLESMQPMGAFKLRGAFNAVLSLPADVPGVVCCSTGNHGRAIAYAARSRGLRAVVCLSTLVPQVKIDGIRALGAEVCVIGQSQDEAMAESQRLAQAQGLVELSPFDDPRVIAGQGTVALELLTQRPEIETLLIPLSGGGLAAGVALAAKAIRPNIRCIGVSMRRGAAMAASLRVGRPVEVTEYASLADSLGGGIGLDNQHSFALCQQHLDEVVLVEEEQIRDAMQQLFFEERLVAEGGSAVGLAAIRSGQVQIQGPAATLITGRNVDMAQFLRLMAGESVMLGDQPLQGRRYGA